MGFDDVPHYESRDNPGKCKESAYSDILCFVFFLIGEINSQHKIPSL